MKKILFGIMAGMLVATAVSAYQAEEHKSGSPMGGMMKGMMVEQKPGEQSPDMMQDMEEMMARMSKMMDLCSQMMGNRSEPKKDESSK